MALLGRGFFLFWVVFLGMCSGLDFWCFWDVFGMFSEIFFLDVCLNVLGCLGWDWTKVCYL
jgi:hypothetical protein